MVRFTDAGVRDDKVLCGSPRAGEIRAVRAFLRGYGWGTALANRLRGRRGHTGVG